MKNKDKIYAGGFLYNPEREEILLHKRDGNTEYNPNQWAFFGGLGEDGETEIQAFIREMKEELNIDISENQVKILCSYFNHERQTNRNIFFVESRLEKSQMYLGEGADFDWIKLDKVFDYDLTDKTIRDLKFFLKMIDFKIL
jgi:8-oxo-dGTP pyrophosphatase MutT (NUDIX family)